MGMLLVYDRRRGKEAVPLFGLAEVGMSAELEEAPYSGLGWWMKLVSRAGGIEAA